LQTRNILVIADLEAFTLQKDEQTGALPAAPITGDLY
jgi:hypothetical protein